jgi:hypothetical protein
LIGCTSSLDTSTATPPTAPARVTASPNVSLDASPTISVDPREIRISPEQAISAVGRFVPSTARFTVEPPSEVVSYHRLYFVDGPGVSAAVDAFDGRVVSLLFDVVPAGRVVLTVDAARTRAEAYLGDHEIPAHGLLERVVLQDHGSFSTYVVTWQGYVGEARVPDFRQVSLDPANGAVIEFVDQRRPYVPPPSPAIGRDEAITRAKAAASQGAAFRSPAVDGVELLVDFAADGTQLLVWEIALTGGDSHVLLHVDALTGTVTFVGAS